MENFKRFLCQLGNFLLLVLKKLWEWKWKILSLIVMLLVPIPAYIIMEELAWGVETLRSDAMFTFNLLFVYIIELVFFALTLSPRFASSLTVLFCGLAAFAEYSVISFRNLPLMPWDLLSFGTAMSVVSDYKYEFTKRHVLLFLGFVGLIVACLLLCRRLFRIKWGIWAKIGIRVACLALCVPMVLGYAAKAQDEEFQSEMGYYPYLFTPTAVYKYNGFFFSFISLLQYLEVSAPEGYDVEALESLAKEYSEKAEANGKTGKVSVENPNVIIIMNESFSDLTVLGDFGYDPDCTPFIDSLTENTVKGQAYVSVKGGNTPNSEWEFLTGNTMAFLPAGSIPYQQYLRTETENFMSTLKERGYNTFGIHPHGASGWKRDTVYPLLGIDESYFRSAFSSNDKIRTYISDEAVYERIIRLYHESLKHDDPIGIFTVTMQNHGGYANFREFPEFEYLEEEMEKLPPSMYNKLSVVGYMALMKISDAAFGSLVEFFQGVDEPTIILMYGDHQPNSSITAPVNFYLDQPEEGDDWDSRSNQFLVPFVLWANYDIEEQDGVVTSLNYLNILLSENAGFELTGYQTYRKELQEKYPVITANFCINDRGELFSWDELDMYADEDLLKYSQLQYNHTFDTDKTVKDFFD